MGNGKKPSNSPSPMKKGTKKPSAKVVITESHYLGKKGMSHSKASRELIRLIAERVKLRRQVLHNYAANKIENSFQ